MVVGLYYSSGLLSLEVVDPSCRWLIAINFDIRTPLFSGSVALNSSF